MDDGDSGAASKDAPLVDARGAQFPGVQATTLRLLFDAMIELAALHEVVRDSSGRAIDYRILDCNAAFTRITGIPASVARGTLGSALYRTDPAPYLDVYARVADSGEPEVFESYFPPMDKHFRISVVSPAKGQFATLATDITAQKRSEEALRRSDLGLRAAQRVAQVGSWAWHVQTGRVEWSDEMYRIFGVDKGDFSGDLGEVIARTIHPDDKAAVERVNRAVLEEGRPEPLEYRVCLPDGRIRTVWAEAGDLERDASGRPALLTGIVMDVTERRQAERTLRESEQRFRRAIEEAPLPIIIHAEDGEVLTVNRTWTDLTGYTVADLPTLEAWTSLAYGKRQPEILGRIRELYALETRHAEGEFDVTCRDGTIRTWAFSSIGLGRLPDARRIVLSMAADLTERKRSEGERTRLEGQLLQSQKIESVGRLAGGIAHDFNNMLSVILGHTEMALQQTSPDQSLHADLREIERAAQRSANLTRQLLAFARKQTVSPVVLDLNATVGGMLNMLQRLLGEDIRLDWRPGAGLWPIRMDPSQVDQILANLCVNARDAISGVGTLKVETGNVTCDQTFCAAQPEAAPGDFVQLVVSDTGSGMDRETLAHLFEPFFTTKAQGKGTGLGLATLYGIVKQNGGFLAVRSAPGSGTTFTIYLPRYLGAVQQAGLSTSGPSAGRGRETILLVEDEPAILKVTTRTLERMGYVVLPAGTPGEAVRLAEEHAGRIDLLMTDVVMPEMNGRDLARILLACHPGLKRLFMSGYTANVIAHQGVLPEGVNFLQKPFTGGDLAAAVRAALDA